MENSRIDLTRNVINSTVTRVMKKNVFQNAKIFIRFFFLYEKFVNSCRKTWIKTKRAALFLG